MSCHNRHHILEIAHLSIAFRQYTQHLSQEWLPMISDLNAYVHEGEVVAVVGSSGSGKSLLAQAVLGILPENAKMSGNIAFEEVCLTEEKKKEYRGNKIAFIPQSVNCLDPLMKVGKQVRGSEKKAGTTKRQKELFREYGLPENVENLYPHECSGGMLRRILLCTAWMGNPRLIIADEPTTGLDRDLAEKVMGDFRKFAEKGNGVLCITHDLELALKTADRVVVFYAGTTLEEALSSDFQDESRLRHPYTRALLRALPQQDFEPAAGTQPQVVQEGTGCVYLPRCPGSTEECRGEIPFVHVNCGSVRCIKYGREKRNEQ